MEAGEGWVKVRDEGGGRVKSGHTRAPFPSVVNFAFFLRTSKDNKFVKEGRMYSSLEEMFASFRCTRVLNASGKVTSLFFEISMVFRFDR